MSIAMRQCFSELQFERKIFLELQPLAMAARFNAFIVCVFVFQIHLATKRYVQKRFSLFPMTRSHFARRRKSRSPPNAHPLFTHHHPNGCCMAINLINLKCLRFYRWWWQLCCGSPAHNSHNLTLAAFLCFIYNCSVSRWRRQNQKSSSELYREAAQMLGLSCTLSDSCRCLDCQVSGEHEREHVKMQLQLPRTRFLHGLSKYCQAMRS